MPNSTQQTDWPAVETAYRSGVKSVRAIATDHNVPEGTIRSRAKKHGWTRNPEGAKRELVRAVMSGAQGGITQSVTQAAMRESLESEADQDIADMRNGLAVARGCIEKLKTMVNCADDPRDIKIIVEATKSAIETIRRIRGLDDPTQPTTRNNVLPMSPQEAYMRMLNISG